MSDFGKTLVTGATGFIGANVVRELLRKNTAVRVLARKSSNLTNLKGIPVEIVFGDLQDSQSLEKAVDGCCRVFHIAAEYSFWSQDPNQLFSNNVRGTKNILEACLQKKIEKVVYTSTVGTIGLADQPNPCNEKTKLLPDQFSNAYKKSKFEAEKIALDYVQRGLPLVIVNPSAPIGKWDLKPTPTGKIIVDFINGNMPAFLATGLNFCHVSDVAKGHLLAAEKGKVGERYILGNQNMSLREFFNLLSEKTGLPAPKIEIPYFAAYGVAWLSTKYSDWVTKKPPLVAIEAVKMAKYYMYFDCSKAIQELGLPQTPVAQAIEEALEFFSEHGFLKKKVIFKNK